MKYMVVTDEKGTYVVTGIDKGEPQIIKAILSQNHHTNAISRDGKFIIVSSGENIIVYIEYGPDELLRILTENSINENSDCN